MRAAADERRLPPRRASMTDRPRMTVFAAYAGTRSGERTCAPLGGAETRKSVMWPRHDRKVGEIARCTQPFAG